jgi:diketogulonate reductase-like aldo/keto reductase
LSQIFSPSHQYRYLIHWPGVQGVPSSHPDNKKYRQQAWKVLTKLRKEGKLKSAGVSNFLVRHLEEFVENPTLETPAVNQVEWHPRNHNSTLLDYCRKENIFLQAYSSLGTSGTASLRQDETVGRIARKLKKSPAQVLLRWSFQQNIGILPKASSRAHIEENIDLDFVIPGEDMRTLSNLEVKEKFSWDPANVA